MSNKILIPVDFSIHSDKAVEYAVQLAEKNNFQIDLLHVFTDHSNIYQNALQDPSLVDPLVPEAKQKMAQLIDSKTAEFPSLKFNSLYADGNLYEEVRRLAIKSVLSAKVNEENVIVLDALAFEAPKTKEFTAVLKGLNTENKKALIVTADVDENVALSGRNIPGVTIVEANAINVLEVVGHEKLIMTKAAVEKIEEVLG